MTDGGHRHDRQRGHRIFVSAIGDRAILFLLGNEVLDGLVDPRIDFIFAKRVLAERLGRRDKSQCEAESQRSEGPHCVERTRMRESGCVCGRIYACRHACRHDPAS